MQEEFPNEREMTATEQQLLEKLRLAIAQATADGILDRQERDRIYRIINEDHKVTRQELALMRTFIQEKVAEGTLGLDYS